MPRRVYAQFLVWNDRKYLPDLFESLEQQTYSNLVIRTLDNGSTDTTLAYLQQYYPHTLVGRNVKNQGFAPGHNQLLRFTMDHLAEGDEDPFILLMNSDMILDARLVEELAAALEADPELGGVQPKLYRAFGENVGDEVLEETMKSDVLDTTGLRLGKDWRLSDRGAGELDAGQYDKKTDILAPSGTMAMYRLSALKDVLIDGEWFDGDFFAYREDCDFALRFKKAGWKSIFVPTAIAWHYRGMYGAEKQSWRDRLKNRIGQRPFFAALSTRNQLFVLIKHLSFVDFIRSFPYVVFGEGTRVVYGFLFEPMTRGRLLTMFPLLPKMLRHRAWVREHRKISNAELRRYAS